ncbi:MAG: RcpC/CpaB family pilus assembly protein, partial [Planctomycetota bacterium]
KLNKERATASQHLREHHKVVTMKADPNSSVTNLVKPGDVVDIMGFFVESEVIPSTESRIVMRGVRVFALDARYTVDDDDSGEGSRGVKTVALEIHEDQAKTFDLANHLGKLSLQMRPINDAFSEADADEEQMKSSEDFLNWLGRHQVERKRQAAERAEAELARLNARRNPRRPVQRPATPPAAPTIKPETAPSRLVQAVPAAAEPVVEKIRMQKIVDGQVIVYELDSDTGLFSVLNADQNSGGVTANDVDPIEAMIKSSNDKSADSSKSKKSSDDSDSISFLDE